MTQLTQISGDGKDTDTANTKAAITDGSKSVSRGAHSKAVGSTSLESKTYPDDKGAEITQKAQAESTPEGTMQEWVEILWQTRKNGQVAGLHIPARSVWRNGKSMIVLAAHDCFICVNCGRWNVGDKCHNCGAQNTQNGVMEQ